MLSKEARQRNPKTHKTSSSMIRLYEIPGNANESPVAEAGKSFGGRAGGRAPYGGHEEPCGDGEVHDLDGGDGFSGADMSKLSKPGTLNTYSLLYLNYTSMTLQKKPQTPTFNSV